MDLYSFFILLFLACACKAGPLVPLIAAGVGEVAGEAAAGAVLSSGIAGAFGVGSSAIWFGQYVIVNGALFYGSAVVGAGALAGGGK